MKCPVDQATLLITERQGVEIDYCPECRGVWLDRGELDKLVDRATELSDGETGGRRGAEETRHEPTPRKKKRTSFLSEMFEGLGGE